MKLVITIETGNEAFQNGWLLAELQRIIREQVADRLTLLPSFPGDTADWALRDLNGNPVGRVTVAEAPTTV